MIRIRLKIIINLGFFNMFGRFSIFINKLLKLGSENFLWVFNFGFFIFREVFFCQNFTFHRIYFLTLHIIRKISLYRSKDFSNSALAPLVASITLLTLDDFLSIEIFSNSNFALSISSCIF